MGDTGGDHDLYDYCVDDPVTMNDPLGLFAPLLLFLGGKALAMALGLGGAYGAAKIADWTKSRRDGQESTAARDAIKAVAPKAIGASAVSALPGVAAMAPGAFTAAGQRVGAAIHSSAHADKIIKGSTNAVRFAESYIVPGPPTAAYISRAAGTAAARIVEMFQDWQNSKR